MKLLPWLLAIALVLNSSVSAQETAAPPEKPLVETAEQKRTEKIRAEVTRRGAGEKSRVRVKLRDGRELKGHITVVDLDSFEVLTDVDDHCRLPAEDRLVTIAYPDVVKVRGPRPLLARIGINIGLTVAVVAALAALGLLWLWDTNHEHY